MICPIEEDAAAIDGRPGIARQDDPRNEPSHADIASDREDARKPRRLHPKLRRLLEGAGPEQRRVERFLSRNRFPLIERNAVTFVFHGEADAVYLHHFMEGVAEGLPLERVEGTNLWHLRLAVPPGSRFEYKFDVVRSGQGVWINDPLNPHRASDPFGANSVGESFGYSPPDWTQPDPAAPPGRIETIAVESRAFEQGRNVGVYLPANFSAERAYPLLVLHDGKDFLEHASLTTVLDNLIHRGEVPPLVAALTDPGERNGEYTGDPRHGAFLTEEVLPAIRERLPIRSEPEARLLIGSSLGAVAALATAFRYPETYGALALMSGSFIFDRNLLEGRDPLFGRIAGLVDEIRRDPSRLPKRVFVGCGIYEGLIGQNRILASFLREHGADVRSLETHDGHHWHNWRDQLQAALTWCLPAEQ